MTCSEFVQERGGSASEDDVMTHITIFRPVPDYVVSSSPQSPGKKKNRPRVFFFNPGAPLVWTTWLSSDRFSNFPIGIPQDLHCAIRVWCHKLRVYITSETRTVGWGCHEATTEILTRRIMWSTVLYFGPFLLSWVVISLVPWHWEYVVTIPFAIRIYSCVSSQRLGNTTQGSFPHTEIALRLTPTKWIPNRLEKIWKRIWRSISMIVGLKYLASTFARGRPKTSMCGAYCRLPLSRRNSLRIWSGSNTSFGITSSHLVSQLPSTFSSLARLAVNWQFSFQIIPFAKLSALWPIPIPSVPRYLERVKLFKKMTSASHVYCG